MTHEEWINMVRTTQMPFLAGGYTQHDWDTINGAFLDDDLIDHIYEAYDPIKGHMIELKYTKPNWA